MEIIACFVSIKQIVKLYFSLKFEVTIIIFFIKISEAVPKLLIKKFLSFFAKIGKTREPFTKKYFPRIKSYYFGYFLVTIMLVCLSVCLYCSHSIYIERQSPIFFILR